jgi:hypothetical protein
MIVGICMLFIMKMLFWFYEVLLLNNIHFVIRVLQLPVYHSNLSGSSRT